MSNGQEKVDRKAKLSAARRALLQKRLQGESSLISNPNQIPKRDSTSPASLSYAQQRLWFLHQMDPGSTAYNMHEAWIVRGTVSVPVLEQAFNRIIQRHDILRTTFDTQSGQPVQIVHADLPIQIELIDVQTAANVEAAAMGQAARAAQRPFDLQTGPLLHVTLLQLGPELHWLCLTMHHIIADEWSNDILWRELGQLVTNPTSALAPLPIQYADFAHWQTHAVSEGPLGQQMQYWKHELNGRLPILQLPTDRPRPAKQSFTGAFLTQTLSGELTRQLKMLSQQAGTTLFMTLLAAFNVLLHRYSRQTDILIGTPVTNRSRVETKDLIGMFLNTLVIRSQLDENLPFNQLLAQVKQKALDGLANQDLPFEKLVQTIQPDRDLSHHPLFQAMFVYQNEADSVRHLPGLTLERVHVDGGVSKFDLTLFMTERGEHLETALEFTHDLFDPATIQRMLTHWQTLLQSIVDQPTLPIGQLNILPTAEWQQVVVNWNKTAAEYPKTMTVHQLIEENAARNEDKTAVQFSDKSLTYAQLNQRANQIAHYLIEQGIQPNDIVGLAVNRSIEMAVGILAILKSGGAYLPLDPSYPADRLNFMVDDAGVNFILTTERSLLAGHNSRLIVDLTDNFSHYPGHNPQTAVGPKNLAYVIYTSGSTGTPKGVLVTHQNLVHSTTARFRYYKNPVERFLLLSSFSFDSSIVGIFWSLCQGGTLCLPEQNEEKDVQQIARRIEAYQATHLLALPSLYQILLEETDPAQLKSLKTVIVAGEASSAVLVHTHFAALPNCQLYNEYGPTEGSVWSTAAEIEADFNGTAVPIGRPIPNMINVILDNNRQPLPIGIPGELYIGGAGITDGYLNRPDLTQARFLDIALLPPGQLSSNGTLNGHSALTGRFYRTGDLVRWLPDGQIEFLGRVDHQVKIRGFRIELGEIEAALRTQTAVQETVVVAREQANGLKQLVAYITSDSNISVPDVRQALKNSLPDYMVPAAIVRLLEMPRLPNGKIDRHNLPDLEAAAETERPFTAPRTPAETKLTTLWQDVLEQPRIGIHDNFFDLGGHSLLATKLISRIQHLFHVQVPVHIIFNHPTVAEMVTQIEKAKAPAASAAPIRIQRANRTAYRRK